MKPIVIAICSILLLASCDAPRHPSPRATLINELPADKVWAHRVNVIKGNEDRIKNFSGIEIDVFYDAESGFLVKHDEEAAGISLEPFLDSLLEIRSTRIWIDYKNLGVGLDADTELANLLVNRGLKDLAFVESYNGYSLEIFPPAINTCYWIDNGLLDVDDEDLMVANIERTDVTMLSGEYILFDKLEEHFPGRKKNYWIHGKLDDSLLAELKRITASEQTNIVLVDSRTNPLAE